ncbi:TatD family hydrolase [Rhizoctonia solani 123E]|uniref:TatD family hydrolase n=1 Tax=Rhizoctonia solani 123E TaxID=1423351 RepID=A0A074SF92_9AGAM|nr:TatD family hydrolase [Rhizoctonia solani 123E]
MCPNHNAETVESLSADTVSGNPLPSAAVLGHIVDVHCHPTDTSPISDEHIQTVQLGQICAMSTNADDQAKVRELGARMGDRVIMCFGYHPWWSHRISILDKPLPTENHYRALFNPTEKQEEAFQSLISSLPPPRPLKDVLEELRQNLQLAPSTMLGEVGIDRAFRVRFSTNGDTKLSPFTVPQEHQLAVLEAQIAIAVELGKNISLHSVKASGATTELLRNMRNKHGAAWEKINIDLHSCTLSGETWKSIERAHQNVYLSLSTAINIRPNSTAVLQLIQSCDPTRLMVESDFPYISDTTQRTWDMLCLVARERGWRIEEEWDYQETTEQAEGKHEETWGAVKRMESNWNTFSKGGKGLLPNQESKKDRRLNELQRKYALDDEDSD